MATSRIVELSQRIAVYTATVHDYLASHNLPEPSFALDAPLVSVIPQANADLVKARQEVINDTLELRQLMLGPKEHLISFSENDLVSQQAVARFNLAQAFPVESEITFGELSAAVGLGETHITKLDEAIHSYLRFKTDDLWHAAFHLCDAVAKWPGSEEPNQTGFAVANQTDKSMFYYLSDHPEKAKVFANAMRSFARRTGLEPKYIVENYTWGSLSNAAIAFPTLQFVVQDLDEAVVMDADARKPVQFANRVRFMVHDFLTPQPIRAAVYYFRSIFHNWPDKYCVKILRALIPVLEPGAKIVINHSVMPGPGDREIAEWEKLFRQADERFMFKGAWQPEEKKHELQLANTRPKSSLAATVEDADESLDEEYRSNDGNEANTTEKLCKRCKDLGLTIGHFIIERVPDVTPRYSSCYSVNQGNTNFSLKTGRSRQRFATLNELHLKRQCCDFCKLASRAMKRYSHPTITGDTICFLTWEIDGRAGPDDPGYVDGVFSKINNKTRRLKLSWEGNEGNGKVYLVLAVPKTTSDSGMDPFHVLWQETHSLGREFSDQTEKQALIRGWLDSCVNEHQKSCFNTHETDQEFLKLIDETYFGVIDVLDMQLKSLPKSKNADGTRSPERYVALSYVWGKDSKKSRYVTTAATVMTHIRRGGSAAAWSKLPMTIQDAILPMNRLGQRYLWIDSLCISQDNEIAWENNAKAMHLIYGHAYFTICPSIVKRAFGL
ncbi:6-hydroxytryprostatin B O-methyltransferase [Cytospora mali]|uniref:6-hydroxytryprostatin B O-methyltransferase n=1 Tax=Cytospora mali TaxID=578113 RepID=A0A194UXC4_CYTMA|nr:6-hydroxytryprostatin B O-methyltransferase [Valsa mali var. pyri (nom. inval.)]